MSHDPRLLISYIAPGAPATRRPAAGGEARLRPEIGFTPLWYRTALESTSASAGTPTRPVGGTRLDLERIVRDYAPCELVLADIEAGCRTNGSCMSWRRARS